MMGTCKECESVTIVKSLWFCKRKETHVYAGGTCPAWKDGCPKKTRGPANKKEQMEILQFLESGDLRVKSVKG